MQARRLYPFLALIAVFALAMGATACGDDNSSSDTSSSSSSDTSGGGGGGGSADDVNAAIQKCKDQAAQVQGPAGPALQGACTSVGAAAIQASSQAGDAANQALTAAGASCNSTVAQLPDQNAKDALSSLCDAIAAAGSD
jgi:hypothetical protein